MSHIEIKVETDRAGRRLDALVLDVAREHGRRGVAELFALGAVRVDGRRARKGERASVGSVICVELGPSPRAEPDPSAPLDVRLELPEIVVVCKPAGQATLPRDASERGTLANALVARYPELADVGRSPLEPGLLHRLDTGTSGLVLAARHVSAFDELAEAFSRGAMTKRYLAVVAGGDLAETGELELPLAPHPKSARRVVPSPPSRPVRGARPAVTRWKVLQRTKGWLLLEIDVSRAVRHQIRAHMAQLGHPIAGDAVYGAGPLALLGSGHALHASYIGWAGGDLVPSFAVSAEMPRAWAALLE